MADVRLVKLTRDSVLSWGKALFDFLKEERQTDYNDYLLPLEGGTDDYQRFATRLSFLVSDQDIALNDNRVPTDYWLVVDEHSNIVGTAKTRYLLDVKLVHEGGHIRLGIAKEHRGKGYGHEALELLIEECVENHGLHDILLTTWTDNEVASDLIADVGVGFIEDIVPSWTAPGHEVSLHWLHV